MKISKEEKEEKVKKEKERVLKDLEWQLKGTLLTKKELDEIGDCSLAVPDSDVGVIVLTAKEIRQAYDKAHNL
jgi:hypothetical protein